ncbi:myelin-oligodendrocyte glycoprotein-like [Pelmatolapia mariae]|uniref:myelin-oligodendrocyte glycoprotein-like n=1 Tax=Pelmatolapia mariae TaxID=158779 RepID=UPI002FE57935
MRITVLLVSLLLVSQYASGVEVYEGEESVLLLCQLPVPAEEGVVVWGRDDLNPSIIHVRTEEGDYFIEQNKQYINRTSIQKDALKTGDLSLTLRKPTFSDSGLYTCSVRKHGQKQNQTEVQLKVKERPPPPPIWPKVLPAVLVPVLVLAIGISVFMCLVYQRMKKTAVCQLKVVDVTEGAESVLLPFISKKLKNTETTKVEWKHIQEDEMKVVHEKNGKNPDVSHTGRTEMKKDPWKTGNASLTLSRPRSEDGGVYICTMYDTHGKALKQKVVALWVKEGWLKTIRSFFPCARQNNYVI